MEKWKKFSELECRIDDKQIDIGFYEASESAVANSLSYAELKIWPQLHYISESTISVSFNIESA